jgi:hypothetical protein
MADTPSSSTHSWGIAGIAANAYDALIQIAFDGAPEPSSTAATSKEQAMSRKPHSLSKQLVVAATLALGTSGVALADDSSMVAWGNSAGPSLATHPRLHRGARATRMA